MALLACLLMRAASAVASQPVTVEWDPNPEPDVAGYVVLIGQASGVTDDMVDVGRNTSWTSSSLIVGRTYYFRIVAYNTSGLSSAPSREVSTTILGASTRRQLPSESFASWAARYGLVDGAADPDGDGLDNASEYLQGTDPLSSNTLYLAEGATGQFEERIALANAGDTVVSVALDFLREDGVVVGVSRDVPPRSRETVVVNDVPGLEHAAASAVVRSVGGQIATERTMTWAGTADRSAAHTAKALEGLSTEWFLAEGEASAFDTYVLLANPNAQPVTASVDFLLESGTVVRRSYTVPPTSRMTVHANDVGDVRGHTFSTRVRASLPVAVERAMYFGQGSAMWRGGHASAAVRQAARSWMVAEGRTGPFFDTWLLIANPAEHDANVRVRYLTPAGLAREEQRHLLAHSRTTILVDALPGLSDTDVSVVFDSDTPIVVERSMYWPDAPTWQEAHNSAGLTTTGRRWVLAEGEVGGPQDVQSYVLVANPGAVDATATLTVLREGGRPPVTRDYTVRASGRLTISLGEFALASGERCSILVDATAPVVVERSMYWNAGGRFWSAGTNETGTMVR